MYVAAVWVAAWFSSGTLLAAVAIAGLFALIVGVAMIGVRAGMPGQGFARLVGTVLVVGVIAYAVGAAVALLGLSIEGFPEDDTVVAPLRAHSLGGWLAVKPAVG
jgi:hypothetical protein